MNSPAVRRAISPSLILLSLAVFLLALIPRLGALERYVTPDELRWVDRSLHFAQALSNGDLASTIQSGHPGITTMWLGSLGIGLQHPLPAALPDFDPQNAEVARFLAPYLDAARLPVIFVVALNLVVLFLLLDRLIDRRAAFLAAGLIALDPFAVALGGILHVDALLMVFSLNSLAALCVALNRTRSGRWLILSGVFAGLAMLSKSPGAILGVATLIILATDDLRQHRSILHTIKALFLWGVAAAVIFILLAPSMWVQPIGTLQLMSSTAEKFSETAHAVNFFNGSYDRDPGLLFYPVVLAFRSTPIMWLGLIAGIVLIVRAKSEHDQRLRSIAWAYWVFAIVFLGVITLGAKKLDRYVLPALDALYVVSALGLAFAIESMGMRIHADVADKKRQWTLNAVVVVLLGVSALQFIPVWPLTLRAYNPLLGGYAVAKTVLPVGGGESAEVGRTLQASIYAAKNIAMNDVIGTAPFYSGGLVANNAAGLALADTLLFTAADFQLTPETTQKWLGSAAPVLTITVQGQPYAWLYPNQWLAAQQQRVQENYQSGDALLTDAVVNVPVPMDAVKVVATEMDEGTAIDLLQQTAQLHNRVWVIHSTGSSRHILNPIFRLLDTYAVQLDEWSTPLSDGALYALPDQLSFTTQPTPLTGGTTFVDRIQLNRAELIVPRVQPGQAIGVVGEWTASGSDAQALVSVMDAAGHQWSTGAGLVPLGDTARARRIGVPVPLTMPPGEYQLVLNVIDVASGNPLITRKADGTQGGIDWPLGAIMIEPAQTPIDAATRKPAITLNAALSGLIAIGTELPPDPIISGDPWTLAMEWTSTSDHLPALDVQWEWTQDDRVVYSTTLPLNSYATDRWRKGEVLQSKYDFRVPISVPDGAYDLRFKVIDRTAGQALNDRAMKLKQVNLASHSRTFTAPAAAYPLDVTLGDLTKLVGADVSRSGTQITVTLYWQAQAITSTNYTAFVQLIGKDDQVQYQIDNWQIAFDAPTSTWVPGQVIADQYVFEVSSSALPPEVAIGVGMYNAATGERLPAFEAGQRLPQDRTVIK
jgi:4-amino-4-deoxy-L-arabinose transferase-like glycosyltransferase